MRRKGIFCLIGFIFGIIICEFILQYDEQILYEVYKFYDFKIYSFILFLTFFMILKPQKEISLVIIFCIFGITVTIFEESKFSYSINDIGYEKFKAIIVKGRVIDIKQDLKKYKIVLDVFRNDKTVNKKVLVEYSKKDNTIENINLGDIVEIETNKNNIKNIVNSKSLSYFKYRGIKYIIKTGSLKVKNKNNDVMYKYKNFLLDKRSQYYEIFWKVDRRYRALIKTMIFGDRQEMEQEEYKNMQRNGIAPILATSGLHIGILYGILRYATRRFNYRYTFLIELGVIWSYAILVGFIPSVMRVSIMLSCYIFLKKKSLFADISSIICLSCILQLCINPLEIYDIGFQLSYVGMFIIGNLISFIKNFQLTSYTQKILLFFAFPIILQICMIPITSYYFGYISLSSFVSNILCSSIASVLIPCGMILFIFTLLNIYIFNDLAIFILEKLSALFCFINDIIYGDGKFIFDIDNIEINKVIGFYFLILFFTSEYFILLVNRKKYLIIIGSIVGILGSIVV